MERNCTDYQTFVEILRQELVPAMGCTEPIAIAYCAARARAALGAVPDYILVEASGNIISLPRFLPVTWSYYNVSKRM